MVTFEPLLGAVQAQIEARRIPGVILRVCRRGEIEVEASLGVQTPENGKPMHTDCIFRIYSMTKPITSLAVMMLLEAGSLALDDPITRFFPEFAALEVGVERVGADGVVKLVREPVIHTATVRDLLRHTAGFTYGSFFDSLVKAEYRALGAERVDLSSQQLIDTLAKAPLAYQPGTTWEYSRATDILGVLVERLSGQSLADFFSERIFAPLGMEDTSFVVPAEKLSRMAEPFALDPDLGTPIRLKDPARKAGYFSGGGGLMSTLDDYQRFVELLRGRGTSGGVRLISATHIDLMTKDHLGHRDRGPHYLPGDDVGFGLGFAVRSKDGPMGHAGDFYWSGLGGTFFWIDPSTDLTAIWLMQAPNQRDEMRDLFRRLVTQSYSG